MKIKDFWIFFENSFCLSQIITLVKIKDFWILFYFLKFWNFHTMESKDFWIFSKHNFFPRFSQLWRSRIFGFFFFWKEARRSASKSTLLMLIYGWINLATNQWKHPQSMDQSESRFSDTGISIFSSPCLLSNQTNKFKKIWKICITFHDKVIEWWRRFKEETIRVRVSRHCCSSLQTFCSSEQYMVAICFVTLRGNYLYHCVNKLYLLTYYVQCRQDKCCLNKCLRDSWNLF